MTKATTIPALPSAPRCLGHSPATPIRTAMSEAVGALQTAEAHSRVDQCSQETLTRARAKLAMLEAWRAVVEYGDVQGRPWLIDHYSQQIARYLDARTAYEG